MTESMVATNDVRFTDRRIERHGTFRLEIEDGALCLVAIAGVGELHERSASFLLRAGFIAVRPERYGATVRAGPDGLRVVTVEYPASTIRRLGPIALGLSTARTLFGRSSVELAWRAPAEIQVADEFSTEALRLFSEGIAIGLSRYARRGQGQLPPLAVKARRAIDRQLFAPLDVAALAASLGCSAAYLSRVFRRAYGFSPTGYVLRRRCERARLLLTRDETAVADIAAMLGFHDASHFARHFRGQCGVSPTRFRQLHRGVKSVPE